MTRTEYLRELELGATLLPQDLKFVGAVSQQNLEA